MLQLDKIDTVQGVTVYGDDRSYFTYYLLPNQPRYRLDEQGRPVFQFIKYRHPIARENGKKGGGHVVFDSEFVAPEDKLETVKETLQERVDQETRKKFGTGRTAPVVKLRTITCTKGTVALVIGDESGAIIEKIRNSGKFSFFGKLISTFAVELTPEGVTLLESALQGKGGFVNIVYDLRFHAKLPPLKVHGYFNSERFYSFYQTISVDWRLWGEDDYDETIRELFYDERAITIEVDSAGITDQKIVRQIRGWAQRTLEDTAEGKMLEANTPVPDDDRNLPSGIEVLTRETTHKKIPSFTLDYKEGEAVEWNQTVHGVLPVITTLQDNDGNPVRWKDYSAMRDLDPFFKQMNVSVLANIDFDRLPINSIEVKINYPGADPWEEILKSPEDVKRFSAFLIGENFKYIYSYQVNYKGENRTVNIDGGETDDRILTINVDDIGVLLIDVLADGIDFDQVSRAQVTIRYEDERHGVKPLERQYEIDGEHREHELLEVIFKPRRNHYTYQIKYFMKDGKVYEVDETSGRSQGLYINGPFSVTKTITMRVVGSLKTDGSTIYLDLKYIDEKNDYSMTKSITLSKEQPFFDWSFPVIDELGGKVMYSGTIQHKDGTQEPIDESEATSDTIMVGPKVMGFLEVEVIPDLIDFATVKLVKVSLTYEDAENSVSERKNILFRSDEGGTIKTWTVEFKNKNRREYTWQATFYMTDGNKRTTEETTTEETDIILELPPA